MSTQINTLVRYAGKEVTEKILAVAQKELATNNHLEQEEIVDLTATVETCKAWLEL